MTVSTSVATMSGVVVLCAVLLWSADSVEARPSLLGAFNPAALNTDETEHNVPARPDRHAVLTSVRVENTAK